LVKTARGAARAWAVAVVEVNSRVMVARTAAKAVEAGEG